MKRVVVIGSNGWLASRLITMIRERYSSVFIRGFDILPCKQNVPVDDFIQGDVSKESDVNQAVKDSDTVFHVVALVTGTAAILNRVNVIGVENVIQACRKFSVKRLIYTSTASVVYDGYPIIDGTEELPYSSRNLDPYNATKAKAEQIVLKANGKGLVTCALRPHSIYGPGDPESWPRLLQTAQKGSLKWRFADDNYLSSYTFVDNICHAEILAAEKMDENPQLVGGKAYNINDGEDRRFWSQLYTVATLTGVPRSKLGYIPLPFKLIYGISMLFWYLGIPLGNFTPYVLLLASTTHTFSNKRATNELGYKPVMEPTKSFEITMNSFKNWAKSNPPKPVYYLSYFLLFTTVASIFGTLQAFYSPDLLRARQFSLQPEQVTTLAAKFFGCWTLLASLIRFQCAFNLENKVLYSLTKQTFYIAFGIYMWEFFITKSIPFMYLIPAGCFATVGSIWMTFFSPFKK